MLCQTSADVEECIGMWLLALDDTSVNNPSIFALSRQPVRLLIGSDRALVAKGACVILGANEETNLTISATGAEVSRAVAVAELLGSSRKVRVVRCRLSGTSIFSPRTIASLSFEPRLP